MPVFEIQELLRAVISLSLSPLLSKVGEIIGHFHLRLWMGRELVQSTVCHRHDTVT